MKALISHACLAPDLKFAAMPDGSHHHVVTRQEYTTWSKLPGIGYLPRRAQRGKDGGWKGFELASSV